MNGDQCCKSCGNTACIAFVDGRVMNVVKKLSIVFLLSTALVIPSISIYRFCATERIFQNLLESYRINREYARAAAELRSAKAAVEELGARVRPGKFGNYGVDLLGWRGKNSD